MNSYEDVKSDSIVGYTKKQRDLRRYTLPTICILMILLLIMRDIFDISINKNIFIIIIVAASILLKYNDIMVLLIFTFPLACGLPSNYLYLIFSFTILLKRRTKISVKQILLPLGFICYEMLLLSVYIGSQFDIGYFVGYSSRIFLFFFLIMDKGNNLDYKKCIRYFIYGTTLLLVVLLASSFNLIRQEAWLNGQFRLGIYYVEQIEQYKGIMTLMSNSNNIGYYAVTAIACLFVLTSRCKKNRLVWIALLLFITYVGMLTLSRTFLLVFIILIIVYLFEEQRRRFFYSLGASAVVGLVVFYISTKTSLLSGYIERFYEASLMSGRMKIFIQYTEYLLSHPLKLLFGASALGYKDVTNLTNATHNGTQQIFVAYGVIGGAVFIWAMIISVISMHRKNNLKGMLLFLPLIAVVIYVQSGQFINPPDHMMLYIIGVMSLGYTNNT